jgi:uncharacterized protein
VAQLLAQLVSAALRSGVTVMSTDDVQPRVQVVVLQPTPFCNIACRYCYLPSRTLKAVMAPTTIRTLFDKLSGSGWLGEELTVIWHAGEPLVVPAEFYRGAFAQIRAQCPDVQVSHSLQTNGLLISAEWCRLFKEWDVRVGVSIDGPKRFNDLNRISRKGRSTFDQALAGIRLLREQGVPFHVIAVLGAQSLQAPEEMLEFFRSEGIEDVCFNVEESEGEHVSELFGAQDTRHHFRLFLEQFWRLARTSGDIRFIREIDGMLPRIFREAGARIENMQTEPFAMLNVDVYGNVSSFSPELLGLKNPAYDDFILGNINTDSLAQIRSSPALAAMTQDIRAGVQECARSCEYFSVCGGGAPVNKLFENGTFASGATQFCTLTQMAPVDLIVDAFTHLQSRVGADAPASLATALSRHARHLHKDAVSGRVHGT